MLHLEGPLSLTALEAAIDDLVARHEVLRVRFPEHDGQPTQRADVTRLPPPTLIDLGGLDPDRGRQVLQALAAEETRRRFDLERGPLIRFLLLRLSDHEHSLLMVMHHIISDGWSTGIVIDELAAGYQRNLDVASDRAPLPEPTLHYADYAHWHRQRLQGPAFERQRDYWHRHLEGSPELIRLPADRPRPAMMSFEGAVVRMELDPAAVAAFEEVCRRAGSTRFMGLLTVYAVLLSRLGAGDDIVIGTPIANRVHKQLEPLIGFFANTLALRCRPHGDRDLTALLADVRRTAMDAVPRCRAIVDRGLEGDHRCAKAPGSGRQVTLISQEFIQQIAHFLGRDSIEPALLRRNLVVRGLNLHALRHQRLRIGGAVLEVGALCHPCSRMEAALGPGAVAAMYGLGGFCCRVLEGGELRVGDSAEVVPPAVDDLFETSTG